MTLVCSGIGIGVTRDIAIGKAYLLPRHQIEITPTWIPESAIEAEVRRFQSALKQARQELKAVRNQIPDTTPLDIVAFIDTHLLMLEDSALSDALLDLIRKQRCSAEWALQIRRDALVRVFDEMDDPYLRTRQNDIDHVVNQIQKILQQQKADTSDADEQLEGRVILASDLTPADTILMRHQGIAAFVTECGGPMSHTAILARSLGIPAVVGVHSATRFLQHGETLIVDGGQGVIIAGADTLILEYYRHRQIEIRRHQEELRQLVDQPSVSTDGVTVSLQANIELLDDIETAHLCGASGVGLYRTEFLYMNRDSVPEEAEHFANYLEVVKGLQGIPITIRTLDLGADKQVDSRSPYSCPPACNPALGLRAVRLCLKEPELFKPQLRAILRVSAHGPVRLMIPMLSNLQELLDVRRLIEETKAELKREGEDFDPELKVGGMIEVPAAALSAHLFAKKLDFFSIGTNDLIQYTLAIDRIDDEVNYLFDPLHPAVLRLIQMTIDAAITNNIPVSMCGEMAGDPRYVPLLLGMGLREFSMQPGALLEVKQLVRSAHLGRLTDRVQRFLANTGQQDPFEFALSLSNSQPL